MEDLSFGKFNANKIIECCIVVKETEKAILFQGIDNYLPINKKEVSFWLPKSVYHKAKQEFGYKYINFMPVFNIIK